MSEPLRRAATAAPGVLLGLLGACASPPQGSVVLLPDAQGADTAVVVKQDGGELVLDKTASGASFTLSLNMPKAAAKTRKALAAEG